MAGDAGTVEAHDEAPVLARHFSRPTPQANNNVKEWRAVQLEREDGRLLLLATLRPSLRRWFLHRHCLSLANAVWIPALGQDMVMVYLEQVADGLGHDAEKLGQMPIRHQLLFRLEFQEESVRFSNAKPDSLKVHLLA